ncbi:hypothetical protein [Suttonella ornithocola]|uniref:Cyanate hydratase N-terminal domain-containing protein n=1 Tax=Suttonella ornithocola TaxID=279832 RepID=A0A380MR68_9GAMM|nr:hypothetical protein [Suttonella ornithocola]SUO95100.1 Uncharacterised protein [Suttonella ornithocola]
MDKKDCKKQYEIVLKKSLTDEQRLQGWQAVAHQQGLSGEYALAARLGEKGFDEERAEMVANLFGR